MSLDQLEPLPLPINNIPQSPSTQFSPLSTPTPLTPTSNYQHFLQQQFSHISTTIV
jgi:hypothetical protein